MILNQDISLKIHFNNAEVYSKAAGKEVRHGEMLTINQLKVPPTVRLSVVCECDECGDIFERRRNDIRYEKTSCLKCQKERLTHFTYVECVVCNKKVRRTNNVMKLNKNNSCSRKCYAELRKRIYHSDNIYSFEFLKNKNCLNCNKEFGVSKYTVNKKFCIDTCLEEYREKYPDSEVFKGHRTNIEQELFEVLTELGEDFTEQENLVFRYRADFYLKKYNLVIEAFGDYWHFNPAKYHTDQAFSIGSVKYIWAKDNNRIREIIEHTGAHVLILWENEIMGNRDRVKERIKKVLTEIRND